MEQKSIPISRAERDAGTRPYLKEWETLEQKIERIQQTILKNQTTIPNGSPVSIVVTGPQCAECEDREWVRTGAPLGHPDFGKSIPCPVCKAPKLEQAKREAEKARIEQIIKGAGLSKHHMYSFDDFWKLPDEYRAGKEQAAEACQIFAREQWLGYQGIYKRGLLLWGVYGTGKTTLATSIVLEVANAGQTVMRVKYADLLDKIQNAYGAIQVYLRSAAKGTLPPLSADQIVQASCDVDLLMIDDLGNTRADLIGKPITEDKLKHVHRIFDSRNEMEKPTVVTTNLTEAQIVAQFSERTKQRIYELCHAVEVKGVNLRS